MKGLENKTLLSAIYYLEQDELTTSEHENIKSQLLKTISRKNIAIYNINHQKVNGEMQQDTSISDEFLKLVRQEKEAAFQTDDYFYHGIFYTDNQGDFVVIAREPKAEFNDQMHSLLQILSFVSVLGLAIIFVVSQYLGYIAYQPITHFITQIKNRNEINFNEPIVLQYSYTEIKELTTTYNTFINQLAQTFHVQKNFIDYVSHELRTPITALMGTLEVTKQKGRTIEEYESVLQQLKQYTTDLQETIDQMMLLSGAKTNFELSPVRIDEVIWEIVENQIIYHQADIKVDLDVVNDQMLTVNGNNQLLNLAIGNLISNAIKYSDNQQVQIQFTTSENRLILQIKDTGIGIDPNDLPNIRQNFFRGKNTTNYQGKGIGLSIADIIFKIHHIELDILPNQPKGSIMRLTF
ncbi:HAMP domain-containing sensor histidine kinase [Sphingobacterium thermophilum]|uniref:histidine kinase n=1 Tax=Sphingobacterium thermophilum TaxID=768534 RepID=A0ABP8R7W0_9SPHI